LTDCPAHAPFLFILCCVLFAALSGAAVVKPPVGHHASQPPKGQTHRSTRSQSPPVKPASRPSPNYPSNAFTVCYCVAMIPSDRNGWANDVSV
jgi:hypothetical protein